MLSIESFPQDVVSSLLRSSINSSYIWKDVFLHLVLVQMFEFEVSEEEKVFCICLYEQIKQVNICGSEAGVEKL